MGENAARTHSNAEFVRKARAILDLKKTYLQHKNRVAVFCYKNRTKYGKNVLVGISAQALKHRQDLPGTKTTQLPTFPTGLPET